MRQPNELSYRESCSSTRNEVDLDLPMDGPEPHHGAAALLRTLDLELQQLIQARGAALVAIRTVSSQSNHSSTACVYQLTFAGGETMKGRCFEKYSTACRVAAISEETSLQEFPQLIAHNGRAVLEPWIVGTLFTDAAMNIQQYHAAGRLLGRLHSSPTSAVWGDKLVHVAARCGRLDDRLQWLVSMGEISSDQAAQISCVARAAVPFKGECGFIHRDICPRNLVIRGSKIYCIDNATMKFGAFDEDLARVRCIWPMSGEQWSAFLAGYGTIRSADSFVRHSAFWIRCVAVARAIFTLRSGSDQSHQCLQQLEQLAAECESFAPIDLADAS